jgi:hypothetical protein
VQPAEFGKPAGTTTFICQRTITVQDELAGEYTDTATEAGTAPEGQGEPVTHESNTVRAKAGEGLC